MSNPSKQEVTLLLKAWSKGDAAAQEQVARLIEEDLKILADHYMRQERKEHTLQPTALVNEVYLRLTDWKNVTWQNRAHFMGVAAGMMRRVLIDHARKRQYLKRGGKGVRIPLEEGNAASPARSPDLIALDEALTRLATLDPRKSQVIELRFFGGLSVEEAAEVMDLSTTTVKREWQLARSWLYSELTEK